MFTRVTTNKLLTCITIAIILLSSGCRKYSEYHHNRGTTTIVPKNFGIRKAYPIKWRVGTLKGKIISKGVSLVLEMPILKKGDVNRLFKNYGANSWIVRVRREHIISSDVLDHFIIPVSNINDAGKPITIKPISTISVNIYYTAAAVSTRRKFLACPDISHRKKIERLDIKNVAGIGKYLILYPTSEILMNAMPKQVNYRPHDINGGDTLVGRYILDIALYDSSKKAILSNWIKMGSELVISKEVNVPLPSCKGFKVPDPPRGYNPIKEFKFKR